MTTFYVATIARYVLVDAADEQGARAAAIAPLEALFRAPVDPARIRTVRPATADEIALMAWQAEMLARESNGPQMASA